MAIELTGLTSNQIRQFLHQVPSKDLKAYTERTDFSNTQRLRRFLPQRTQELLSLETREEAPYLSSSGKEGFLRCEEILEKIVSGEDACLFCCILKGRTPAEFVYQGEDVSVIMDIYPLNPGHMLVLPHTHAPSLTDLDPGVFARMSQTAQGCGRALLKSSLTCDGFNLMIADGSAAGQEIFHPHLHVLPRFHGDGLGMKYPEGYPRERNSEKLSREAEELSRIFRENG